MSSFFIQFKIPNGSPLQERVSPTRAPGSRSGQFWLQGLGLGYGFPLTHRAPPSRPQSLPSTHYLPSRALAIPSQRTAPSNTPTALISCHARCLVSQQAPPLERMPSKSSMLSGLLASVPQQNNASAKKAFSQESRMNTLTREDVELNRQRREGGGWKA